MAAEAPRAEGGGGVDACMKLMCSHGGRFVPCGPDGALRYVGGETRVLALPRSGSFRNLAARLSEMAGGAEVSAIRHRLTDEGLEDVIVSVTCDGELAHMRDEYDRLRAKKPTASFRVFVTTIASASGAHQRRAASSGLPPLAPKVRRLQSEQELAARAQLHPHRIQYPAPLRRVQSARELSAASCLQPSFHHQGQQYRRDVRVPAPPKYTVPALHVEGRQWRAVMKPRRQEHAPTVPAAKTTGRGVIPVATRFVAARA